MWRTQDTLGNIEKDGREEGANSRVTVAAAAATATCAREGKAERHELTSGQGVMGTYGVKACVVLWRPLEDVSRLASTICLLTKGKPPGRRRAADRMRDLNGCVRVRVKLSAESLKLLNCFEQSNRIADKF